MGFIAIREARSTDLPLILKLLCELDHGSELDLGTAKIIFERMKSYPNYSIFVGEIEGEMVGTFALLIMDNLAHRGAPSES